MKVDVEFLRVTPLETVARVTITPSWLRRLFGAKAETRYAVRGVTSTSWHWDDTGERVWNLDDGERIENELESAHYWANVHPKRVHERAARRRVLPDGSLRPPS